MLISDFFSNLYVPDFLKNALEQKDWFLLPKHLKTILDNQVSNTKLNSNNASLKVEGKVYIGKNCKIGDYTVIQGPVFIGDNVEIAPHCFIRPGSIISQDCVLGHSSEIKNAVMMAESRLSGLCFLGDSIIGYQTRFGINSMTSNRRFDQQNIDIVFKDMSIPSDMDKFGAIVGDKSRLGSGVSTNPGTVIGKNTFIASGAIISGFIPANTYVKYSQALEMKPNNFKGKLNSNSRLFT